MYPAAKSRLLTESFRRLFKVEISAYSADARKPGQRVRMIARDDAVHAT